MEYNFLRPLFIASTIVLLGLNLNAQNLVRNPNFTELDSCPYTFGQIYFANHWSSDNDQSPDLFDSCVTAPFFGLPFEFPCPTSPPY
ncbi:MAG: hypothetical protein ACJA01_000419 [Saprospiraceae bacterium]|jgi:hypothetical protein